jgi:hypothetical protein
LTNVKLTGSKKSFQICNAKQIEMNGCSVKPLKGAPLLLHNAEVTGMEQPAAR